MQLNILGSGSSGNCYILQDSDEACVIEAGIDPKKVMKAIDYKPSKVTQLLISHNHGDHAGYKDRLLNALTGGLDLRRTSGFKAIPFSLNHDVDNVGYVIEKGNIRLMYATDTRSITAKCSGLTHLLVECNFSEEILSENVEKGIIHPVLADRIRDNHLSLERLIHYLSIIDKSKLKGIVLCHLSDKNSRHYQFRNEVGKVVSCPVEIAENQTIEL